MTFPPDPQAEIRVYVPADPRRCRPRPGSAIVGSPTDSGQVVIDFEDGQFVPAGFADLAERAWGRHVERYPTIARTTVSPEDLIPVGWFDPVLGSLDVEDPGALESWAPGASEHLLTTSGNAARTRDYQAYLAANPQVRFIPAARAQVARMMGVREP